MPWMSSDLGADSSSHFPFTARTNRQTQSQTLLISLRAIRPVGGRGWSRTRAASMRCSSRRDICRRRRWARRRWCGREVSAWCTRWPVSVASRDRCRPDRRVARRPTPASTRRRRPTSRDTASPRSYTPTDTTCTQSLLPILQQLPFFHTGSARCSRGVATGWTGVDISTPLLPQVVPETDANPVSFYSGQEGLGSVMVWSLTKIETNLLLPLGTRN